MSYQLIATKGKLRSKSPKVEKRKILVNRARILKADGWKTRIEEC
jgi:hypothetical protein